MLAKLEPSAVEMLTHSRQPSHPRFPVGKYDADVTRSTCGLYMDRWNWLRPTLIHIVLVLVIKKRSCVNPSPVT
jgi:hypothetical protein